MKKIFPLTLVLSLCCFLAKGYADPTECGPKESSQPTTEGPSTVSTPPSTPSTTTTTTQDQMGLTLDPNPGGGSLMSAPQQGGGGSDKKFGPSEFMKMMKDTLSFYLHVEKERQKRIRDTQLRRQWERESSVKEARANYLKTYKQLLKSWSPVKEQVKEVGSELARAEQRLNILKDMDKRNPGIIDKWDIEYSEKKVSRLEEKLNGLTATYEAEANEHQNARQTLDAAERKMSELEASWRNSNTNK